MISRIPALELMHKLAGTYNSREGSVGLRIWRCGYGVAIELSGESKSEMVGVVGANGQGVECFAQWGLPNVVRMVGQTTEEESVAFEAVEPPINLSLSRKGDQLKFDLLLAGSQKASYVLQRA